MILKVVAPFTGAWIETEEVRQWKGWSGVAPFTGAWIETRLDSHFLIDEMVAPFTGAWIETAIKSPHNTSLTCRTLHGCVD